MLMLLLVAIDVGDAMYGVSGGVFIGGGGSSVNLREVKAITIHDLYLLCRPDCPEVTLCGWEDIKIQLLLLLPAGLGSGLRGGGFEI